MNFKIITPAVLILIVLMNIVSVSAITGSIGNARMILRAEQGDEIEKYVLVKNVNDVAVNIKVTAGGDLADYIDIKDKEFTLQPGDELKAQFTIKVAKAGTTESRINVQFTPVEESKNGVGLSSTVIVIAEENSLFGDLFGNDEEDETDEENENNEDVSLTGEAVSETNKVKMNPAVIAVLIMTLIIAGILIYMLSILYKKANKKDIKIKRIIKTKKSARK